MAQPPHIAFSRAAIAENPQAGSAGEDCRHAPLLGGCSPSAACKPGLRIEFVAQYAKVSAANMKGCP